MFIGRPDECLPRFIFSQRKKAEKQAAHQLFISWKINTENSRDQGRELEKCAKHENKQATQHKTQTKAARVKLQIFTAHPIFPTSPKPSDI